MERVYEQQIEAILICPEWKGAMWLPQLVKLRTKLAPIRLPAAAECLRLLRGRTEELSGGLELPNLDPLYVFHIRWNVV